MYIHDISINYYFQKYKWRKETRVWGRLSQLFFNTKRVIKKYGMYYFFVYFYLHKLLIRCV